MILDDINIARGKIRENFNKSLIQLFNDTDFFDSQQKQDAFKIFLEKIKDGSLEIKKTVHPNHAKLYLFENKEEFSQGGEFPGTVITGSSNLTISGLKNRYEINVVFRDEHFDEGKKLFLNLWNNYSVKIVDKDSIDDFFNDVIEKIWYKKLPKPFLLYIRVLEEYFSLNKKKYKLKLPAEITKNKFLNLKYQTDAIKQAMEIIEKHGGVIIADVVGLGKSIIASAIAHNLGLKTIIIAPPHLIDQWDKDYRWLFNFNALVFSSGSIEKAIEHVSDDEENIIIVDEAHKYRNEQTFDYANLHRLCQGNKIMLLSATPFSNRPQDIFSMIKLFQIPLKSTIRTVDSLSHKFKDIVKEYKKLKKDQKEKLVDQKNLKERIKKLAEVIRSLLSPLIIRRSRLDLDAIEEYKDDLKIQNIFFPEVKEPKELEYDLGDLKNLYISTLYKICPPDETQGFNGTRYKPVNYLKNIKKYTEQITRTFGDANLFKQTQINLAIFMKRLLVRRFESSIFAFHISLDSMIQSAENVIKWYNKFGKVPIYKKGKLPDVDSLMESTGDEALQELDDIYFEENLKKYFEKGLQLIDKKELKKAFIEDLEKDIQLLKEIKKNWFDGQIEKDPKLEHFYKIIKDRIKQEPNRKIVVFSEYSDTVNYLYDKLKDKLRVFRYTSKHSTKQNKRIIKENFDAGAKNQKNDYDVLIATDAISEGFNLHRAGIIFNYDIPYNPTRVIQRVGRINRVNKKVFDELFIFNFFPTATGETETRTKEISTLKIDLIHALLGEDTKILTSNEELQAFFHKQYKQLLKEQEELSWDVEYLNLLNSIKYNNPEIINEALEVPKRVRIQRTIKKDKKGVIVFGKKGNEYTFKLGISPEEYISLTESEAFKLFEASLTEISKEVSPQFDSIYQKVKQELFTKKTQLIYSKGKADAVNKILVLKKLCPEHKAYFDDLHFVIEKLDSLPEFYLKKIRAISENNLKEDINYLRKYCPHSYLIGIIDKSNKVDEGEESLILSEELI